MKMMTMFPYLAIIISNLLLITNSCLHQQSTLLLQFKQEFVDSSSDTRMENWNSVSNCCRWDGVSCDRLGRVVGLDLSDGSLTGSLRPNSSLFALTHLLRLNLAGNDFYGSPVPAAFGHLSMLNSLDLSRSMFAGQLPSSFANLTRLSYLDLSKNRLAGEFPVFQLSLKKLSSFSISYNLFSGPIPDDAAILFPNSSSLETLELSHNRFNGTIPSWLFRLPSLSILSLDSNEFTSPLIIRNVSSSSQLNYLYLGNNRLTGEFPSSILELTSLTELSLIANELTGNIDIGFFSSLRGLFSISLSYNNLSVTAQQNYSMIKPFDTLGLASCNLAEFPKFLEMQTLLYELDLTRNRISGNIPRWFHSAGTETLARLFLSENRISGWEKEPSVLPWNSLEYLDLSNNNLRGSLVPPPPSMLLYLISKNHLTGEIPKSFCKLSRLRNLDVSDNKVSGKIPQCLGFNSSLTVLNLKGNVLQGQIPSICAHGSPLKTLDLSHNELHGTIPISLIHCRELEVLNVGHNRIIGEFPFWTQNLPSLIILVLRENKFRGNIWRPGKSFGFKKLQIIDLSFNSFTGDLPEDYFRNWTAINSDNLGGNDLTLRYSGDNTYYQYSIILQNKGVEILYEKIMITFMSVDLSNNKFTGKIPSSVGELKSLIVLNLSSNGFEGGIPSDIGNLKSLESLDLSNNVLSGEIPRRMSDLTFLSYLNLSENSLWGQIPQGGQLSTFMNSSYGGNEGLCGDPLTEKCGAHEEEEKPEESVEGSGIEFGWRAVVIGWGFGLLTGFIIEHAVSYRI